MIDRKIFFADVRANPGKGWLQAGQVDGINHILDEWERRELTDLRWCAYILATCWHETAQTMQPVKEMGGEHYLKSKPYYPWYGRGLLQITWSSNYAKFGCEHPDDMLTWPFALRALFDGMIKGMFTGHKLDDYFHDKMTLWVSARRIINGMDKASMISGYAVDFFAALKAASATK